MPLRDHFHSPVNDSHQWNELHGQWPAEIVRHLLTILPPGYRSGPTANLGSEYEVDVANYELDNREELVASKADSTSGVATLLVTEPTLSVEADFAEEDEFEVRIYDVERSRTLVAAIELLSPANKDRPTNRTKFIAKCVALLRQNVCVSIVDLVTVRQANLYLELLASMGKTDPKLRTNPPGLYAVTLRTRQDPDDRDWLDTWFSPMNLGEKLPTLPIWLSPTLYIMLDLEVSYEEACRVLGIRP